MYSINFLIATISMLAISVESEEPVRNKWTQSHPWQTAPWQSHPWQTAPWQSHPWQTASWQTQPWQTTPPQHSTTSVANDNAYSPTQNAEVDREDAAASREELR